jgi:hypothetical protein
MYLPSSVLAEARIMWEGANKCADIVDGTSKIRFHLQVHPSSASWLPHKSISQITVPHGPLPTRRVPPSRATAIISRSGSNSRTHRMTFTAGWRPIPPSPHRTARRRPRHAQPSPRPTGIGTDVRTRRATDIRGQRPITMPVGPMHAPSRGAGSGAVAVRVSIRRVSRSTAIEPMRWFWSGASAAGARSLFWPGVVRPGPSYDDHGWLW